MGPNLTLTPVTYLESFREISVFNDNHPLVKGTTMSFSFYMIGDPENVPEERVWRKSVASALIGCTVEKVNSTLYSVKKVSSPSGIWLGDLLSCEKEEAKEGEKPLVFAARKKLSKETKDILKEHYDIPKDVPLRP